MKARRTKFGSQRCRAPPNLFVKSVLTKAERTKFLNAVTDALREAVAAAFGRDSFAMARVGVFLDVGAVGLSVGRDGVLGWPLDHARAWRRDG
jgi:hypothetical protein